tara:strand:+ start:71 stop:304 length:234 start_codon:yes stop_codon:yes gene_type:complete
MDPEGIYLGSRMKVLQEEIKKVISISGIHSFNNPIFELLKKDLKSLHKIFFRFNLLIFKIILSNYIEIIALNYSHQI